MKVVGLLESKGLTVWRRGKKRKGREAGREMCPMYSKTIHGLNFIRKKSASQHILAAWASPTLDKVYSFLPTR